MKIDWAALGVVAVVSVVATLAFVVLLSLGIRQISVARVRTTQGRAAGVTLGLGYALLVGAGLLVLFGIYLIVPQFG